MILSKIISKIFKVKIENENQNKSSLDNVKPNNNIKINSEKEKNKDEIIAKLKSKLGKLFNVYLMNSKIIDNENENHISKIMFFVKDNLLFLINSFFDNFKDRICMKLPKEILSIIINILIEYDVDCESVINEFKILQEKINLLVKNEKNEKSLPGLKLNLRRSSTSKKIRKNILSKKRTRNTKLSKKLEKGATKIEKYFRKSSVIQEINFENIENSKKFSSKKINNKNNNEINNFLKEKTSPEFFNLNSKKSNLSSNHYQNDRIIRQGIFSTIFENENNLNNDSYMSLNESRRSKVSCSKEKEKEKREINYKNYFKNSFLKTRNYSNPNPNNYDNYSCVSFMESSGQPVNYLFSNVSHFSNNNYHNNKFINMNNSFSHLRSVNQSFENENYSQQRKSSNVTFGFQFSNNSNANNLNNFNIFNSSFLNQTDILNNNISMSHDSNIFNEKLYDELNGNLSYKTNPLKKQNSYENKTLGDIYNTENIHQSQGSNSNLLNQQKSEKSEAVSSPQNYVINSNQDNLSKVSSSEFNLKIKKPKGNFQSLSNQFISSSKSTNNSIFSNNNNSQLSLIQQKSNENVNPNSYNNNDTESKEIVSTKKINLSFHDNDSIVLNSSFCLDSQSFYDCENRKTNKSYGLNTLLHNKIDNLPKMKKIKNENSNKKIRNSKKFENKFINMIFNKLNEKVSNSIKDPLKNENESINLNDLKKKSNCNELDIRTNRDKEAENRNIYPNFVYTEKSDQSKINNENYIEDKHCLSPVPKKQVEEITKSPEIIKNCSNNKINLKNNNSKKYKNGNIKNYLSAEKPKNEIVDDHTQNEKNDNVEENHFKKENENVSKAKSIKIMDYTIENNPILKEINKSNFGESLKKIKEKNYSESSNKITTRSSSSTIQTCTTTASEDISKMKTGSYIDRNDLNYTSENFLNKKRKNETINNKLGCLDENNENNKNADNIIDKNNKNKNLSIKNQSEINVRRYNNKKSRKVSIASITDDEILAFQTPDKRQEVSKVTLSPNTVSKKNLMVLFAQIKKN